MSKDNINWKNIPALKQKDLLSLPLKPSFSEIHTYESIIVCPTRRKHDSGWRLMALIGCKLIDGRTIPVHIIGYCDDINWRCETVMVVDTIKAIRCDMTLSSCIRFWSNDFNFKVGIVVSSTDIFLLPK